MKSRKRQEQQAKKRAAKKARMANPGFRSKYALKKIEQANGKFRPTSPFVSA